MLVCYLDDSFASTSTIQTIAGYVASEDAWEVFEGLAEQVCEAFGVDIIHCREFDSRKGCFKGWSVPMTIRFLHAIGEALQSANIKFGISRSIPCDYYKHRKGQLKLNPSMGAYGFVFGTIVFSMRNGDEFGIKDLVEHSGIAYRVESGHNNNPELAAYIRSEVAHGNLHPDTSIEFVDKLSCRAIQIADLYAFYSRKRANRWWKTKGRLVLFPDVWMLHVQDRIPHLSGLIEEPYTEATLERTGKTFQIQGLVTNL